MAAKSERKEKQRTAYDIASARVARDLTDDMQAAFDVSERLKEAMEKRQKDRASEATAGTA